MEGIIDAVNRIDEAIRTVKEIVEKLIDTLREVATRIKEVIVSTFNGFSLPTRKELSKAIYGKVSAEFIFPKKNRKYRKIARRNRKGIN